MQVNWRHRCLSVLILGIHFKTIYWWQNTSLPDYRKWMAAVNVCLYSNMPLSCICKESDLVWGMKLSRCGHVSDIFCFGGKSTFLGLHKTQIESPLLKQRTPLCLQNWHITHLVNGVILRRAMNDHRCSGLSGYKIASLIRL